MSEWISLGDDFPEREESVLLLIAFQRVDGGRHTETNEICIGGIEKDSTIRTCFIGNKRIMWDLDYNLGFTEDDIIGWKRFKDKE